MLCFLFEKVRPRTFGCIAMDSALLFIVGYIWQGPV